MGTNSGVLTRHHGSVRLGVVVPIALALAATSAVMYVRSVGEKHKQAQIVLVRVENEAVRQEVEASRAANMALFQRDEVALRPVMTSLERSNAVFGRNVSDLLAEIEVPGAGRVNGSIGDVRDRLTTFTALLTAGEYDDAWRYHRVRVEPSFELLASSIADVNQTFAGAARTGRLIADGGTFLTVAIALAALVALQRRSDKERQAFAETLARQALRDPLTDLANRRLLNDRLEQALARSGRYGTRPGLVFIDLDGFKPINDELGHDAGDRVLTQIARRLESCTRATDTVARMGGDEFAVLVDDARLTNYVESLVERILTAIQAPFDLAGSTVTLNASAGVAVATEEEMPDALIARADGAMYEAKRAGKGTFRIAASPSPAQPRSAASLAAPQLEGV